MKIRTLFVAAVVLLLGAVAAPIPGAAQGPAPMNVLLTGPNYDQAANVYSVTVSVSRPQQVKYLIVSVEDADGGTVIIQPFEVSLGGFNTRQFPIEGARFKAERKYLLKVQAVDLNGNLIPRPSDSLAQSAAELYTLASKEFVHQPPSAPKFEFAIESGNADFASNTLTYRLRVPTRFMILKYNGFIVDDSGQQVGAIAESLFSGPNLVIPLPAAIRQAVEERTYKTTLNLFTRDDQQAQAVYEMKLKAPPPPGLFERVGAALALNSTISLAIVALVALAVMAYVLTSRRARSDLPLLRPQPIENTQARPRFKQRGRLSLRIVQSPGAAHGVEKKITSFPCLIGRDEKCDICVKDQTVSRQHLEITLQGGQFLVTDLSKLGTYINDVRLRSNAPTPISGVVSLRLGEQTFIDLDTGD